MVQPQRLQVLDEPVEELDVEPADLVDEAGVLLVDELDQVQDGDRGPGATPGRAGRSPWPRIARQRLSALAVAVVHHPGQGGRGEPRGLLPLAGSGSCPSPAGTAAIDSGRPSDRLGV